MIRLKELNEITFKSDEEQAEFNQLQKEVNRLIDSSMDDHKKQLVQDESILNNELDDIDYTALIRKKPSENNEPKDIVNLQLVELQRQKTKLQTAIKVAKTAEEVEELKKQLQEIVKEQSYFTSKPDEHGYIKINEAKFQQKLKLLEDKLAQANGFSEKLKVKMAIASLKMYKRTIQTRNKAIWTGRGVRKVSGVINTISKELEPLAKLAESDPYSPKKEKKGKKKKKGKKGKHKDNHEKEDQNKTNDFGFNTKNVFDTKGDNWI